MSNKGLIGLAAVAGVLIIISKLPKAYISPSNDIQRGSEIQYFIHLENFDPNETVNVTTDLSSWPGTVQVDENGSYVSGDMSAQSVALLFAILNETQAHFIYRGQVSNKKAEFTMRLV